MFLLDGIFWLVLTVSLGFKTLFIRTLHAVYLEVILNWKEIIVIRRNLRHNLSTNFFCIESVDSVKRVDFFKIKIR